MKALKKDHIDKFLKQTAKLGEEEARAAKMSAVGRIRRSMNKRWGTIPIPTECKRCGVLQPSVREAKYHKCDPKVREKFRERNLSRTPELPDRKEEKARQRDH